MRSIGSFHRRAGMMRTATAAIDDGCESYDEDIGWILDRLTDRAGGSFGVIFRCLDGAAPAPMASTSVSGVLPADLLQQVADHLLDDQREAQSDELVGSSVLQLQSSDGVHATRLLFMEFRPAAGVQIFAVVGRPDHSALLLQRLVAKRLHPVLARYIRLWWMHRTERRRAYAFETAIDEAELGVLLLDRRGQLVYENAYSRRILDDGDGMRRIGKTFYPVHAADSLRLQAAVQHALLGNQSGQKDGNWQAPLVLLHRGNDKRPLMLTILAHRRRAVDPDDPAVIVHLLHPERDMCKSLAPACRIYGLTSAESRLVVELVNGASLLEFASGNHISAATARSQLKHVFEKTRTSRQAELIKVMLASAMRCSASVDLTLT